MPRRAENRNRAQKRFDSRAPVFAVFALRGVNGKRDDGVNWNQHPEGFCQVSGQITGQEELREGKNEDGQMKQHDRINQIGNDLARNAGAVVDRERILREVWHTTWYGSSKTVDVHVAALRRKLGDPGLIETVRGIGLRLAA